MSSSIPTSTQRTSGTEVNGTKGKKWWEKPETDNQEQPSQSPTGKKLKPTSKPKQAPAAGNTGGGTSSSAPAGSRSVTFMEPTPPNFSPRKTSATLSASTTSGSSSSSSPGAKVKKTMDNNPSSSIRSSNGSNVVSFDRNQEKNSNRISTLSMPSSRMSTATSATTGTTLGKRTTDRNRGQGLHGDPQQHKNFLRQRRQLEEENADDPHSIEYEEAKARKTAKRNNCFPIWVSLVNFFAALKVFLFHLITVDTIASCTLTAGMTWFWWEFAEHDQAWHGNMHFILVSFAVATPITVALRMAFDRREKSLACIATVRSFCLHIYLSHALWDWKGQDGRHNAAEGGFDFEAHCDEVLWHIIGIGDEMTRFLTMPTFSNPRHRVLHIGRHEASQSIRVAYRLLDSVLLQHMTRLTVLAERLKAIGLSGSEISRVRQYERHLSNQLELLRMYKVYRTPQALWAFGRLFTILMPPFYAPTFTTVGRELKSLWLGIAFGVVAATCLTTLFESVQVLEDPFTAFVTLDGIDVSEELEVLQYTQLLNARKLLFPQSPEYPLQTRAAIRMSGYDPTVHYHSTAAMREQLLKQEEKHPHADPYEIVEEGHNMTDDMKKARARRNSHNFENVMHV